MKLTQDFPFTFSLYYIYHLFVLFLHTALIIVYSIVVLLFYLLLFVFNCVVNFLLFLYVFSTMSFLPHILLFSRLSLVFLNHYFFFVSQSFLNQIRLHSQLSFLFFHLYFIFFCQRFFSHGFSFAPRSRSPTINSVPYIETSIGDLYSHNNDRQTKN
jgi:hypothetical protein